VRVGKEKIELDPGGKALVAIWAPDYAGTTVGPIRCVFASVRVEAHPDCHHSFNRVQKSVDHIWWWWYYGNSPVNHEFKRDVWGIPNALAQVETTYDTSAKGVRLLENGRLGLRLGVDLSAARVPEWMVLEFGNGQPIPVKAESELPGKLGEAGVALHKALDA